MDKRRFRKNSGNSDDERETLLTNSKKDLYEIENFELKKTRYGLRKKDDDLSGPSPVREQFVETEIQPNETLQTLSLKYNIPIAEIKRINNILNENEFFALKRIKLPVKPLSLLSDLIPGVHSEQNKRSNGWYVDHFSSASSGAVSSPVSESEGESSNTGEVRLSTVSIGGTVFGGGNPNTRRAKKFLKSMDKDLAKIRRKQEALNQQFHNGDGSNGYLAETRIYPIRETDYTSSSSSGAAMCWCCVAFVVVSVIAILVLAKYEFNLNHHEMLSQVTGRDKHQ